jgi:peptidoglycan/LPS O-acetylase OafA/YrhL
MLSMESNNLDLNPRIPAKIAIHFLLGAACGLALVVAFVRFSWVFSTDISTIQIFATVLFVVACGILSATLGNKALAWLGKMLESSPV